MLGNLTGLHLLIILGIVILLFGATKLPALAKGLGQSITIFKKEMGHRRQEGQGHRRHRAEHHCRADDRRADGPCRPAGPGRQPRPVRPAEHHHRPP